MTKPKKPTTNVVELFPVSESMKPPRFPFDPASMRRMKPVSNLFDRGDTKPSTVTISHYSNQCDIGIKKIFFLKSNSECKGGKTCWVVYCTTQKTEK